MILGTCAITLLGGRINAKYGLRFLYLNGVFFNLLSMGIFALSSLILKDHLSTYLTLLAALLCLGIGFGFIMTVITPYMFRFFKERTHPAVVGIYAVLCLGATLSPILFEQFSEKNIWWVYPLILSSLSVLLLIMGRSVLEANVKTVSSDDKKNKGALPLLFWLLIAAIFLYGFSATAFSNWGTILLHSSKGLPTNLANYGLSLLWGMMVVGRLTMLIFEKWIPLRTTYVSCAFLLSLCFIFADMTQGDLLNLLNFALAGVSMTATFPLTFSFASKTFLSRGAAISGYITTSFILGYGLSAYGIGFSYDILKVPLETLFLFTSFVAFTLFLISWAIVKSSRIKI